MRLNIFRIPSDQVNSLKRHLNDKGLTSTRALQQDGWKGDFLFSTDPNPGTIPWVNTFAEYIGGTGYYNRSYFAVMLLQRETSCYAIAFGKAHFYVRPYCDYDFGIEMAKRVANADDVNQTSARRFQGKQRKDIRSFLGQARLSVPPGNSIDYLQGRIIPEKVDTFGSDGKFGTSCLLAPTIEPPEVGALLSAIDEELAKPARFKLPRTLVLSDEEEVARYDEKLVDELLSPVGTSDISTDTFDLFGVDFVFGSSGSFTLRCGHYRPLDLERLTMKEVKEYLADRKVPRDKVLALKITHRREGEPDYTQPIREAVDYICDEDHVVLRGGKWLKFNEDYLEALDDAIRRIAVEETEEGLIETALPEGEFNKSLKDYGYVVADKDFDILKTAGRAPSEAWDLQKGDTVYAVKFGTPQKLNYVVDQASSVVELIHNGAQTHALPPFRRYCLWFGYRAKKRPASLAESGSIILKQKVEAWARQCEEVGFVPVLKLSRKIHLKHDSGSASSAATESE
ncbi:DUF6119 family protein [Actinotalea fermentans]|uniref:Sporadically distributed protein, TIGR04141 family n=1 Tax=Actinotalea fermentans TaxID=43671 RepID=A0A511YUX6_9CELL|nr:DUF6119 family protein [Actinotalea fermentans]KGM17905.1 hypothetical protein N867_00195 [Actinotalea fermentans ATCC 43279 = JCM 9966 = DSM 3133]GEN78998.1 hypothetical protein AFE02nite_07320 [Actinotalea fermentans]